MARIRGITTIDRNTDVVSDQLLSVESGTLDTLLVTDGTQLRFVKEGTGTLAYFESNTLLWTSNSGASHIVGTNTVDGADNRRLILSSNNTSSNTRGASIVLSGNEATNPGFVSIQGGDVASAAVVITSPALTGLVQLGAGNSELSLFSSGSLRYNNSLTIHSSTVDAADNQRIVISGGGNSGNIDTTRGAGLQLSGNEHADVGRVILQSGSASGSRIDITTPNATPIRLSTNAIRRWDIDGSTGNLLPGTDLAVDIGESALSVNVIHAATLRRNGTALTLQTTSAHDIVLHTNNLNRWLVRSDGHFRPELNSSYDIGAAAHRVRVIYVNRVDDNSIVDNEIPTGVVNNINTVYTTTDAFISTSLKLYYNGLRQIPGASNDFTVTAGNEFTMTFAPNTGDTLLADYRKS